MSVINASFYVNSTLPVGMSTSNLVNVTNLTINPQPVPYGQVQYMINASTPSGVPIFLE